MPSDRPSTTALTQSGQAGRFGRKRQLEAENAELRQWLTYLGGMEAVGLAARIEHLRVELHGVQQEINAAASRLAQTKATLVHADEKAMLQEVGIYEYLHPLDNVVTYQAHLGEVRTRIKSLAKENQAVLAVTQWQVNGSQAEGRRMVRDFSRLMLRAYNAEADKCVQTVRPARLRATIDRLAKVRESIARLGRTMSIRISDEYHAARIAEIRLTADYRAKQEEEKELQRAERERRREESAAQRDFEREKSRLSKEHSHYEAALAKLRTKGDHAAAKEMEAKLAEIDAALHDVEAREANTRAGYVYVISNIGSFGTDMVKIGMTRRLEPEDRVRELGDASVPFRFDTHALIFSHDAVGLESRLHDALADRRVNQVNLRREFFYTNPAEVREVLQDIAGQHLLEYHETPDAEEWRASSRERPE